MNIGLFAIDKDRWGGHKISFAVAKNALPSKEFEVKPLARILVVLFYILVAVREVRSQETIPFVPSPMHVVNKMLEVAEIKKGDILYDMGSGDGRVVIEAAKKYGIRGVGVDLNPELVAKARENAERLAAQVFN